MSTDGTVLDVVSIEQLRDLKERGFVIVHREPTEKMIKNSVRDQYPEERTQEENWHRMVGESIKEQNEKIKSKTIVE